MIVQKVFGSLSVKFNSNFSSLEELRELDNLKTDEFHGILTHHMKCEQKKRNHKKGSILQMFKEDN